MLCYKDRTYCPFYKECEISQNKGCSRDLTPQVLKEAAEWWGGENAPISVFSNKPECFRGLKDERYRRT